MAFLSLAALQGCGDKSGRCRVCDGSVDQPDGAGPLPDGSGLPDAEVEPDASTPPPPIYSFVVFGDNQFATTSCTSGIPERLAVPEAIRDLNPTFILHTGDLMDHGYDAGAYDQLVSCYSDMLGEIIFFPTSGNHDMGNSGILNYKAYLEQQLFTTNATVWGSTYGDDFTIYYEDDPNVYSQDFNNPTHTDIVPSGVSFETFFAVHYANAVIISFEQGTRWWTNTPKSWLEDHLAQARSDPDIEHIFVTMHHPMYSTNMLESGSGECILPVREPYEQLFRDYDVTIVFSGHNHFYDRFYVPDDGTHTRQRPPPSTYPHDGQGVHYIVTGGGGGPLPNCNPMPGERLEFSYDYSQARGCGYHVTRVEVDGGTLTISIVGVSGDQNNFTTDVWDQFTIQ
jgi:hypothetical protein